MLTKGFDYAQNLVRPHRNPKGLSCCHGWCMAGTLVTILFLTCGAAASASSPAGAASPAPASTAASKRVAAHYGKIPLGFEANQGQTDPHAQFLSRGSGYSLFLTPDEVILNLERQKPASSSQAPGRKPEATPVDILRMKLVGANTGAAVAGVDPQPGVVSYLIGNDPKKWHSGIPTYGKVEYLQIYPGVDLVFYGNQRQLEYDFVVAPGADPSRIAWRIDGARASVDAEGNLALSAPNGPASFKKPVLYQMDGDKKIGVEGSFEVAGNQVRFRLDSYDHSRALIIDPVLSYATYLSGSSTDNIALTTGPGDLAVGTSQGLALDSEGSAYVTGHTYSIDFPTENPFQSEPPAKLAGTPGVWPTAFVTKFSPDGSSLVYSTYLGGNGWDIAYAIAVDSSGDAYVTGQTDSPDFPITAGAYQTICSPVPNNTGEASASSACGTSDTSAFVTKLNATGTGLVYSTFLGGYASWAYATAIAVDTAGRAYIAGNEDDICSIDFTFQSCFPTTTGAVIGGGSPGGRSPQYAFAAAFDPTGSQLLYSTLFGGTDYACENGCGGTYGTAIAVDANGYFYLTGETSASDLPTTAGVIQPTAAPLGPGGYYVEAWRGFIAKFRPVTSTGGASLAYATYLGGHTANLNDYISGVTIDSESNAYIVGYTNSPDFPVTKGAYSTVCGPGGATCSAAHVTKLNSSATVIHWSTFVGGAKSDGSDSVYWTGPIQLDGAGNVYLIGQNWPGFPMINPVEPTPTGGALPVLVAELNPQGARLLFSTTIGSDGLDAENPAGLAVDTAGDVYLAGNTAGPDLITTPGAFQTKNTKGGCCYAGFVVKIASKSASVSPTSLSFGNQVMNTPSAIKKVTLTNTSTTSLSPPSIGFTGNNAADFTATDTCSKPIAPTYTCTISVTYTPTLLGTETASLIVTDDAGNSPQEAALTGTGVLPVELSPTSLSFGNLDEGVSSAAKSITVTNYQKVTLTEITVSTTSTDYTQTNTCDTSLAAGKTCKITVTFKPSIIGADDATLSISDSASNSPQTAALTGKGLAPVSLTPTSETYASQTVGTTSTAKVITLTNNQSTTVSSIAISTTGDFAVSSTTCTTSLTTKAKCSIDVVFKPTATGTRTGTLSVSDSAANSPQTSKLTGTGK